MTRPTMIEMLYHTSLDNVLRVKHQVNLGIVERDVISIFEEQLKRDQIRLSGRSRCLELPAKAQIEFMCRAFDFC